MTMNSATLEDAVGLPMREQTVQYEGKSYRLLELSEDEGILYELELHDKKNKFDVTKMRRALIAYCWRDAEGKRIVDDSDKLKTMRRSLAGLLYQTCQKLNNYDDGELEGLVKNSEPVGG
jgi:hypothetical protein